MAEDKRRGKIDRVALERAMESMLKALGVDTGIEASIDAGGELTRAPARAAELWADTLLAGMGIDLRALVAEGICQGVGSDVVSLVDIGVYLVCPHHLTVAFGQAHVAYVPSEALVGFGTLSRLVEAATRRLVLQEVACESIVEALFEGLGARAAVVAMVAVHPCNNVAHPAAISAKAITWAERGDRESIQRARSTIAPAVERAATS